MMRKKNKRIIIPVLCSLLLSASAEAADINIESIKVEGADVTVSGMAEKTDAYVTMVVLKKGGSTENTDDILTVGQKKTDASGAFSLYFEVPKVYNGESSEGEYEVLVHLNKSEDEKANADFLYISEDTRKEFLDIVKTKTAAEIADAVSSNSLYEKGFMLEGAQTEKFLSLPADSRTALFGELLAEKDKENITLSSIAPEFNILAAFYELDTDKNVSDNLKILNPVFEEKEFNTLNEDEQQFIQEAVKRNIAFKSYQNFKKGYIWCGALYKLNSSRFSDIDGVMSKYKTELELENDSSYKKYLGFSGAKKQTVQESIVKALENSKVYTKAEYKKTLQTAVDSIPSDSGTGGSGGGGGSSSSGKNSSASNNTYIQTEKPNGVTAVEADVKEKMPEFSDLEGVEWAKDAILELAKKGIISGRGENKFDPDGIITREEFVKIIVEAAGVHESGAVCGFEDVAGGSWYESYVASAVKHGLVLGQSDKIFGVGKPITRQDVCVIASKLLKNKPESAAVEFADAGEISEYAVESISMLTGRGIVSGMGENEFRPKDTCTRAQAAKIVFGILREE